MNEKNNHFQQEFNTKNLMLILLALLLVLFLVYFIYRVYFRKDTTFIQKVTSPVVEQSSELYIPLEAKLITGSEVDKLENKVKNDKRLQKLKRIELDLKNLQGGNSNPFQPFYVNIVEPSKKIQTLKPIQRVQSFKTE